MAEEGDKSLLYCGICKNMLENPRYLSCLHSFCEHCLRTWIAKTQSTNDEVSCKICHTMTKAAPDEGLDSNDPVDGFPRNNFISSLVEREKITSKNSKDSFCHLCFEDDGVKENGTHWCQQCSGILCQNCAKFHKKVKNLAGHKVYLLDELRERPDIISKAFELCEIHPDEKFENYCYSHDVACCVRCMVNKHRHCDNVVTLEKWVLETQNAHQTSKLLQDLDVRLKETDKKMEPIEYLNEEITNIRKNLDNHLNKLEKQLREEVAKMNENTQHEITNTAGKNVLKFSRLYLQKLLSSGTTVQLLTSMNKIRSLLARTKKAKEKEEPTYFIQLDDKLKNFEESIKFFGHIDILDESFSKYKNERGQQKRSKVDEQILPKPAERKGHQKHPGDVSFTNNLETKSEDDVFSSSTSVSMNSKPQTNRRSIKTVDNIAEIERKLKIFIDNHITKVLDTNFTWQENECSTDNKRSERKIRFSEKGKHVETEDGADGTDEEESSGYAKIDKNQGASESNNIKDRNQRRSRHTSRSGERKKSASRQKSVESSSGNDGVKLRQKRHNKKKTTEQADTEKDKLNDLITKYLMKTEQKEKKSPLSKNKSFYFSTPNIPSSIKDNEEIGTLLEDKELIPEKEKSVKRRNSLHASRDDPLYDVIDYERLKPFLDSEIVFDDENSKQESESSTDINLSEEKKTESKNEMSDMIKNSSSDYQIYNPQSQVRPSENIGKLTSLPEKGKPTPKLRFFEKAKQKLRFHKRNGKFDVEQAEKKSLDEPQEQPIYVGTEYEEPARKAAHEVPVKKTKTSHYEENFQIIFPNKQQLEQLKDESIPEKDNKNEKIEETQTTKKLQAAEEVQTTEEVQTNIEEQKKDDSIQSAEITSSQTEGETGSSRSNETEERRPSLPKGVPIGMPSAFGGMQNASLFGELKQRLEAKQKQDLKNDNPKQNEDQKVSDDKNTNTVNNIVKKSNVLPVSPKPKKRNLENSTQKSVAPPTPPRIPKFQKKMTCYEISPVNDFNVQSGNTLITGGVLNSKGRLFLIDKNEQKLYIFKCDAECEDVLQFKESPWDIALINDETIAISFPNSELVEIVDVKNLKIAKSLEVNENCYGIDYENDSLVVRCSESIKIISLEGEVQHSMRVQTDLYGYVAGHGNRIYYTHKSSVICIDKTGNQLFLFENPELERAEGLTFDVEGNLYVAGMDSNNIWQISSVDGKESKKIISSLKSPQAVAFCNSLNRFLIAYDSTSIVIYDAESPYGTAV